MVRSALLKKDGFINGGIIFLLSILSGLLLLNFPHYFIYIFPGIAVFCLIIAAFLRNPVYFLYLYFLSFTLFLQDEPGIQVTDVIFFSLTLLFIFICLIPYIITGRAEIDTSIDKWYVLFIISLGFGFINGLIVSNSRMYTFSDMTYFIGVILYFPFKYHFKSEDFRRVVFLILIFMCGFVLIRNFLNYREIIVQSTISWEIQDARVAENEIIVLVGAILSFLAYAYHPNKLLKVVFFFIYSLFVAGLILTQSRGYWITLLIATVIIVFMSDQPAKKYTIAGPLILGGIGIFVAYFFFNHIFFIVIKALSKRFTSISTVSSTSKMGASLLERVLETKTIVTRLLHNPIAGYGMGTTYQRYYILLKTYMTMTYIHDGYLAIWFKAGLVGLLAIVAFCLSTLKNLWRIFHSAGTFYLKFISLASFSLLTGMLIVNVTSPQFLGFDSMTLIILMGVFASFYSSQLTAKVPKAAH